MLLICFFLVRGENFIILKVGDMGNQNVHLQLESWKSQVGFSLRIHFVKIKPPQYRNVVWALKDSYDGLFLLCKWNWKFHIFCTYFVDPPKWYCKCILLHSENNLSYTKTGGIIKKKNESNKDLCFRKGNRKIKKNAI